MEVTEELFQGVARGRIKEVCDGCGITFFPTKEIAERHKGNYHSRECFTRNKSRVWFEKAEERRKAQEEWARSRFKPIAKRNLQLKSRKIKINL